MTYTFDGYHLDTDRRELRCGDAIVPVEPGVFDLVEYLVRHRDRVISKDELVEVLWDGRIVSESTLTSRVTAARHVIGDSGSEQRLIRTVPRKGLRFVAQAVEAPAPREGPLAGALERPAKPSIAVLPFSNLSGDPEKEYFSDGISEDLIMALSRLRWFFVIARNSSFAYKGQPADVREIGKALDVDYLLDGSVRRSGSHIRITCQLLDAATGNNLWAERYDREMTDLFVLQDEIITRVVSAVGPELVAAESLRAESRTPDQLQAWDIVARALPHFWKFTSEESERATDLLRDAVLRYPSYAPASSMLAFGLMFSTYVGWIPPEPELARSLAERALALDSKDPWAHVTMGLLGILDRDTDAALKHFDIAIDLNPNLVPAVGFRGFALALDGYSDEAMEAFEHCVQMNPRDPHINLFLTHVAAAHYLAGNYDDAIDWARRSIRFYPEYLGGYRILTASLGMADRPKEAQEALKNLLEVQPEISIEWARERVPYTERTIDRFLEGLRRAGLRETLCGNTSAS